MLAILLLALESIGAPLMLLFVGTLVVVWFTGGAFWAFALLFLVAGAIAGWLILQVGGLEDLRILATVIGVGFALLLMSAYLADRYINFDFTGQGALSEPRPE